MTKGCEFKSRQEWQENFLLQSQLWVLTLIWCLFHPQVTAVAHKRHRSFCQKCRGQITPEHLWPIKVRVGWLCCCAGIVWETTRKRANTQLLREHSVTVISTCWAIVDWSWPKEWNKCARANLLFFFKSAGGEWTVKRSPITITQEEKATINCRHPHRHQSPQATNRKQLLYNHHPTSKHSTQTTHTGKTANWKKHWKCLQSNLSPSLSTDGRALGLENWQGKRTWCLSGLCVVTRAARNRGRRAAVNLYSCGIITTSVASAIHHRDTPLDNSRNVSHSDWLTCFWHSMPSLPWQLVS